MPVTGRGRVRITPKNGEGGSTPLRVLGDVTFLIIIGDTTAMDIALPLLLFLPDAAKIAIGTALMLGVIVTSLFYMLASVLQHPPLFAMAKENLSTLIFSAVIIGFWIASSATIDPLVRATLEPTGFAAGTMLSDISTSHVTLSIASTDILIHKLKEMYVSMYLYEALIGFLSTISFPLGSPVPGAAIISFSIMPFDGLNLLSNAHTIIVEAIGQMLTFVWAKQFILIFARDAIPLIFLPLGLVMRAIPIFKTTGSSIISICFAAYFVLPFAVLFSNYLIFDIYDPSDFVKFSYSPQQGGAYKTSLNESTVVEEINLAKNNGSNKVINELFNASAPMEQTISRESCPGNAVVRLLCGFGNVIVGVGKAVAGFASTVWSIWKFMLGLTGDFFSVWTNPLLPSSTTSGLYYFIIDAVVAESQFLVLVLVTSLIEIVFTITMYRNIALIIGGELEIAGLSKII